MKWTDPARPFDWDKVERTPHGWMNLRYAGHGLYYLYVGRMRCGSIQICPAGFVPTLATPNGPKQTGTFAGLLPAARALYRAYLEIHCL